MAPFLSTNWSSTPTTQSAGEAGIENRWMDGLQTEKQEKNPSHHHIDNISSRHLTFTDSWVHVIKIPVIFIHRHQMNCDHHVSFSTSISSTNHWFQTKGSNTHYTGLTLPCLGTAASKPPAERARESTNKTWQELFVVGPGTLPRLQLLPVMSDDPFVLDFCLQLEGKRIGADIGIGQGCR